MENILQKLVGELDLDKFYNDFKREDYSYNYFIEIYAYKVIYEQNNNKNEVIYIGNRTIPIEKELYTNEKYNEADYWLNGSNDMYIILHRYTSTCNMTGYPDKHTYNKLGNQKTLNKIKQYIIDKLNTNFNIMIMPKEFDLFDQIGRQIYQWKSNIKNEMKKYTIDEFIEDFKYILDCIRHNSFYWHKYLIIKNRFWFISIDKNDIEERKNIKFDDFTTKQKVMIIVMKEWLGMIINNSYVDHNYNMHIDKVIYKLENIHFKNEDLFNHSKVKLFEHKTAIKLLLSTMYNTSTPRQIEDTYKKFMNWRSNYITKIFTFSNI